MAVRNQPVLLDCDVAKIYGLETKRINEAVRNNPEKFPEGFLIELSKEEAAALRSKSSSLRRSVDGNDFLVSACLQGNDPH